MSPPSPLTGTGPGPTDSWITLAGLAPMGSATNFPSAVITRQEKTIKGSYYGTIHAPRDFPMLLDLNAAGQTLLVVTHNPELAGRYASRVIRLADGRDISDTGAAAPSAAGQPGTGARP